ncbi:MAG: aspartate/tyrosine/aromatic aminotransferase [Rhodobacter sp.]|nr:aspartate/tyrosine/aromatic aminotransferase [Rhodobacter sp.]MCA3494250.1 aspartate/tyrosine/aromatic aminotransferase [Rhodobacter sp.]MCA3499329.1 aspartate/tyrosine/aromatic aminotransferase [Rhodobacter sp.]MCA3501664.1 aspartate/tyrosine/aromatic aminotransferase [Rhodobacter sp.]MCA3515831.1 aspartate/tyrosine/aromatic aminotransferase [Rhodobacter sp.]
MFDALKPQPQDKILQLIQMFRDDPRPGKIDLGVGVYKDATGLTPVMRAVRMAGKRLWESETSKTYTGLAGDPAFHAALSGVILGGSVPQDRIAAVATPGGTGAIRQALELIRLASPAARVWLSDPTWPNHPSIIRYLGIPMAWYRYFDAQTRGVDAEGMLADLGQVAAGDVVLLHGCCHNPTGANLTLAQWAAVADLLVARGAVPLIDLAYQGFGDGLEADAAPTRVLAARCPEVLIAASCSKTFGIYRERTGLLIGLGTSAQRGLIQENLSFLNRQNYSFPPDHGARLVTLILEDPALTAIWAQELEEIRLNMLGLRQSLAEELRRLTGSDRWGFIARHRGMFSVLGATEAEVARLRDERGIYMVSDSRMNIAGLNAATVPVLARAIADIVA